MNKISLSVLLLIMPSVALSMEEQTSFKKAQECYGFIPQQFEYYINSTDPVRRYIGLKTALDHKFESAALALLDGDTPVFFEESESFFKMSPLHYAAWRNMIQAAKKLIERGAPLNFLNMRGDLPLNIAIENKHQEIALLILNAPGALVNSPNEFGDTPAHRAAFHGLRDVLKALVERGAQINALNGAQDSLLHVAIENKHQELALYLLSLDGINFDTPNKNGDRPLHRAVFHGLHYVIDALIKKGADINARNGEGNTPLQIAVENRYENVVSYLVRQPNINVTIQNGYGDTPLHRAAVVPSDVILKMLCAAGAGVTVNVQNGLGWVPLHNAVYHQHVEHVDELLKVPFINMNLRTTKARSLKGTAGKTPLALLLIGHTDCRAIAMRLLQNPATDVTIVDDKKRTPLMHAVKHFKRYGRPCTEVINHLLYIKKVDANALDKDKCTALHYAVLSSHAQEVVPLILARSLPSISVPNTNTDTPLYLAKKRGYTAIVAMMQRWQQARQEIEVVLGATHNRCGATSAASCLPQPVFAQIYDELRLVANR